MKRLLFIFLSFFFFQQMIAQTIVRFDNGKNIIYKNLQGKTVVKKKGYIIAFTDTISFIALLKQKRQKKVQDCLKASC